MTGNEKTLIEMRGIGKAFPGVQALSGVDFELQPGEVHVLLGENGAGKSTLMKVLAGVYPADRGDIFLESKPIRPRSVLEAQRLGITMVMQEFNLIPDLSVAENIALINRPEGSLFGRVRPRALLEEAQGTLDRLGIKINAAALVRRLSVAQKQMVEIARAMSLSARVLVLDEPTAALSDHEVKRLFELIQELTGAGVGVVYISHRFEEIFTVGHRVTVLRDGRLVSSRLLGEVSADELIRDMAGRELKDMYPRTRTEPGKPMLEARGLSTSGQVREASLTLRQGEILGLSGLMGAGRTELGKALFGAAEITRGEVRLFGKPVKINSPVEAMARGLAYCAEDRKDEGLFLGKPLAFNISITNLRALSRAGLLSAKRETRLAREFIDRLRIRPAEPSRQMRTFSGGGQQKAMLAKWLTLAPRILILDEPTRGIDVAAKVEVYEIMDKFVGEGGAILLISSDLPELLALSDRILVMHEGRIAGEFSRAEFDQEKIMALATGLKK